MTDTVEGDAFLKCPSFNKCLSVTAEVTKSCVVNVAECDERDCSNSDVCLPSLPLPFKVNFSVT